ncbi:hypothetical protein CDD80_2166 [Ophiocordyceps camponoti-rufipedis]|uniref:Uncharacterized protein n=1 Tax=Ophiocordyceps camponoti-rufipedis TaxID=2004952 RepID=A0A2C5XKT3_9HYPO|nr:hypothetical protein CDD80_2166 [Ophiocordyceps camponoti-rufipedis]
MTRRPLRASRPLATPLPLSSTTSTPLSSALPSTCASEAETEDDALALTISSLNARRSPRRRPQKPFPFLDLPPELRIKVYHHYFDTIDPVVDLGPGNHKRIHKLLGLMRVSKLIHAEATHFFYSSRTFRLFPTHPGRYFKSKKPLLSRLKPSQRLSITSLELRLGPGWNAPPKGWVVNEALGLRDCIHVDTLSVFVECDPSDGVFKGFRRSDGFYEAFSRSLLAAVVDALPSVRAVRFDAWTSVKKSGAMMRALLEVAAQSDLLIRWGPERGWSDGEDDAAVVPVPFVSIHGYAPDVLAAA